MKPLKRRTPKYFVLDFKDNSSLAYTTDERPESITFELSVRLKTNNEVVTVVALHKLRDPHVFSARLPKRFLSLYKSNLQKCVRRRLSDKAVRTAYAIISADPNVLLRRLPVIAMEDVLPHNSLINVVWWMMVTSKVGTRYDGEESLREVYQLSTAEITYVLNTTYLLTEIDTYEFAKFDGNPHNLNWSRLPSPQRDLLWCMEFRKAYGGMSCDVNMLNYLQVAWYHRFSKGEKIVKYVDAFELPDLELSSLGVCDKRDIILQGIDYHCFPWMIKKLQNSHPDRTESEIKGAIWFFRSRTNVRELCEVSSPVKEAPDGLFETYREISQSVERLARWILNNIVEENLIT